jgi:hypothetical protein
MTSTLTAISTVPGAGGATRARPANARLAPGGQERGGDHDARVAQKAPTGEAARWQRILDLLDPGIEGTGSYGAGLARHIAAAGIRVVEAARAGRTGAGRANPTRRCGQRGPGRPVRPGGRRAEGP